jgi:hypothetical protein
MPVLVQQFLEDRRRLSPIPLIDVDGQLRLLVKTAAKDFLLVLLYFQLALHNAEQGQ